MCRACFIEILWNELEFHTKRLVNICIFLKYEKNELFSADILKNNVPRFDSNGGKMYLRLHVYSLRSFEHLKIAAY